MIVNCVEGRGNEGKAEEGAKERGMETENEWGTGKDEGFEVTERKGQLCRGAGSKRSAKRMKRRARERDI